MISGIISYFNNDRGFGVIISDDGTEYFCHISEFKTMFDPDRTKCEYPSKNDAVLFDTALRKNRTEAVNISII